MYLDRAWLGLRFLRAVILYNLPDVLVYIRVINSSQAIRVVQLMCTFICIVFFGSGLCFFLENNGDPWHDYENHADPYLTYFTSFYYMVVTMSTVGYGDISTQTDLGRVFIIFFIIGGLSVFANALPEIIQIIGTRPK